MTSPRTLIILATLLSTAFAFAGQAAAADGEKLYNKHCKKCHSVEPGKHGLGPSLAGIFGKPAGKMDFTKYKALKGVDFVWDEDNMSAWIADPKAFIGKPTTMVVKVKKPKERAAIIEYLKQF